MIRRLAALSGVTMLVAGALGLAHPPEPHVDLHRLRDLLAGAGLALGGAALALRHALASVGARPGQPAPPTTQRALAALLLLVTSAVALPALVPPGALDVDLLHRHLGPSPDHALGTDRMGRDLLATAVLGAPVSLAVALTAALTAATLGAAVGVAGGWLGGPVDRLGRLLTDTLLATPSLVLQLLLVAALRPEGIGRVAAVVLVIGATAWTGAARLVRAEVRALSQAGWVESARILGLSEATILRHHVLPHLLPMLGAWTAAAAAQALLAEAALSWLGLGIQPPLVSWGGMLQDVRPALDPTRELLVPGGLITLTAMTLAQLADGLSQVSPRQRSSADLDAPNS